MEWSTGTSALHIACRDFTCNDYEKVYLLGFDHDNNSIMITSMLIQNIIISKDSKRVDGWKADI